MKYDLVRPCKDCPFRTDIKAFLTPARAREICDSMIQRQMTFSCHKLNEFRDNGEVVEGDKAQHCAGALIFLERLNRPNQMMRIAQRLGMYDSTKLDMDAPIFRTPSQMIAAQPKRRSKPRPVSWVSQIQGRQ